MFLPKNISFFDSHWLSQIRVMNLFAIIPTIGQTCVCSAEIFFLNISFMMKVELYDLTEQIWSEIWEWELWIVLILTCLIYNDNMFIVTHLP